MACEICDGTLIPFRVPDDLQEIAPDQAAVLQICATCLTLTPTDTEPDTPAFSEITTDFPDESAGAAMALAVGLLVDSLTLNRAAILRAFDRVQADGHDPWLVLDRLATSPNVDPAIDLARVRTQLDQLA